MAGLVYGSVDHIIGNTGSTTNNAQELFVAVYNFLNARFTRIAAYYGVAAGGLDGTGLDYWDAGTGQAAPQAFAVFRIGGNGIPSYNIILFWTNSLHPDWTFDGSVGNGTGVGMAAAARDDGLDAWNGTTANDGTDTTGTPRWSLGAATTIFTFDYFNEPGGTRATNRDNLMRVPNVLVYSAAGSREILHMWADDDCFFVMSDQLDGRVYQLFFGAYDVIPGSTQADGMPAVALYEGNGRWMQPDGALGPYGTTTQEGGGLLPLRGGGGAPQYHLITHLGFTQSNSYQPNRQLDVQAWNMPRIGLVNVQGALIGQVGYFPNWIRYGVGIPTNARNNTTPDRAFFGNPGTDISRGVMPWHTAGPPGASVVRAGTQFTWNGP